MKEQNDTTYTDIIFVSSYIPRNCGIATFTHDLCQSMSQEIGREMPKVVAISNVQGEYNYPSQVKFEIRRDSIRDYARAAEYINNSSAQLVSLQHEFGLFGGAAGNYLSVMLSHLKKPIVTTLHTILREPTKEYRKAFEDVIRYSYKVVPMSNIGVQLLKSVYNVPSSKISLIHHGVHDVPFVDSNYYKEQFGVEGRTVLLTFGLLSPNKGIENMLDALPSIVERFPDVIYIVLGATHPEVKRSHGEKYRLFLEQKVRELGLDEHVIFENRFVDLQQLKEYICCCDIYVTPYLSVEQITSGTLAYAIGMGKCVVSTPYFYARELLSDGRGVLVEFNDIEGLSKAIVELIENPLMRNRMRKAAYDYGRAMTWKEVAKAYLQEFSEVLCKRRNQDVIWIWDKRITTENTLPEIKLDHIKALSDDVGIFQHAAYGIPTRSHGYSSDDVGRALAAVMSLYNQQKEQEVLQLAKVYLSFLQHAQTETGHFHNFMSFEKVFLDDQGSEDTLGRVIWGLGTVVRWGPTEGMRALAQNMIEKSLPQISGLKALRARAYAINGIYHLLQRFEGANQARSILTEHAEAIVHSFEENSQANWRWFEDALTYGNAKIPEALLLAYECTGNEKFKKIGLEALDFLTDEQWNGVFFELVGNEGWYPRGGKKAIFGQQPIDAAYLTQAYVTAYNVTEDIKYLRLAHYAFEWFLGRNRLNASLYNFSDGSVADGIDSQGISLNQGAESVVCYILAVLDLYEVRAQLARASVKEAPVEMEVGLNIVRNLSLNDAIQIPGLLAADPERPIKLQ